MKRTKVIQVVNTSIDTFVLRIEKVFDFLPGQAMELSTDGVNFEKAYICSGVQYTYIEFFLQENRMHTMTRNLRHAAQKEIFIKEPDGDFLKDARNVYKKLFIASEASIGPFLSFISSYGNVDVIHELCDWNNAYGVKSIKHYTPCIITYHIPKDKFYYYGSAVRFLHQNDIKDMYEQIYICGKNDFVFDVTEAIADKEFSLANTFTEFIQ